MTKLKRTWFVSALVLAFYWTASGIARIISDGWDSGVHSLLIGALFFFWGISDWFTEKAFQAYREANETLMDVINRQREEFQRVFEDNMKMQQKLRGWN